MGKIAASVLLLFINGKERCHTTGALAGLYFQMLTTYNP